MILQSIRASQQLQFFPSFCTKLAQLLKTGIQLPQAVEILAKDTQSPLLQKKLTHFHTQMMAGRPFCAELAKLLPEGIPFQFSQLSTPPQLIPFLEELGRYYQTKHHQITATGQQLVYPATLLVACLLVGIILGKVLIPSYVSLIQDLGVPLPGWMVGWATLQSYLSGQIVTACIAATTGLIWLLRKRFQALLNQFFFPVSSADLIWVTALLLKSGIPLQTAVSAFQFSPQHPLYPSIQKFRTQLNNTGTFAQAFITVFKPGNYATELLLHAEKSAAMSALFLEIATHMRQEETRLTEKKISRLQPILLALITLLVMGSFTLMMSPILTLAKSSF